jgi:hypothetical protein
VNFNNGPLPDEFRETAYVAANEFALPRQAAIQYLKWAESEGLKVLGFDVWSPTELGPTVRVGVACEGDARQCLAALEDHGYAPEPENVFNVWVAAAEE